MEQVTKSILQTISVLYSPALWQIVTLALEILPLNAKPVTALIVGKKEAANVLPIAAMLLLILLQNSVTMATAFREMGALPAAR